jgi:hypothetical protein
VKREVSSEAPAQRRRGSYAGPLPAANVLVVGVTPEVTMPEPYTLPCTEPGPEPVAGSGRADADRTALDRALAARSVVAHWALESAASPGLFALPAGGPSARESSAARLQAPVPDHHRGD